MFKGAEEHLKTIYKKKAYTYQHKDLILKRNTNGFTFSSFNNCHYTCQISGSIKNNTLTFQMPY